MRVIVVGGSGQLGQALLRTAPEGVSVLGLSRGEFDLTAMDVEKLAGADVIINAAAYTDVDGAEANPELAHEVNAVAPGKLAEVATAQSSHLIHISTDYVFGGDAPRRPLLVDDLKRPNTVYGRTKLAGEQSVFAACPDAAVVRTAWLFTGDLLPHKDFVSTMLRLAREGNGPINVVNDQWGNPTCAIDLAGSLWRIAERRIPGVFHGVGSGYCTWFDLARETFAVCGADPERVNPCSTSEFPRPAPRPAWSVLDASTWLAADLPALPEWRSALRGAVSTKL
ncbi:dTDP-4-dehydrorhamnose reductase [Corynebacterium kalinowskii]|uniref:dTDP-4-dehydrorhamnose reductase n=1 Tax=Corynebacterium kalinowskii TaxID=2675216 RepID=A0A6B8VI55_9CORY|nr:dTDP-4-dehydrorhamnose reductase [Corynebacterium kalinowskii]QGU02699.1 dTDP-4-dehydrorhamnose reductase [Corynebacterium kalinowskii]